MDKKLLHLLQLGRSVGKDLGKFYKKRCEEKSKIERYSASHGHCCDDVLCSHYQKAEKVTEMVNQNMFQQLVEALESLDWVKWVKSRMAKPETPAVADPRYSHTARPARDGLPVESHGPAPGSAGDDFFAAERELYSLRDDTRGATAYDRRQELYQRQCDAYDRYQGETKADAERVYRYAMSHGCGHDQARSALGLGDPLPLPALPT